MLLYHRVADLASDPFRLAVSPEHFAEHLTVLKEQYSPVRLDTVVDCVTNDSFTDRSIAVTFDDGYSDILHNALPLLRRFNIPATVFVTSGYIGSITEPWWDALERICLQDHSLPASLTLSARDASLSWEAQEERGARENATANQFTDWDFFSSEDFTDRHRVFRALYEFMKPQSPKERELSLATLFSWAGIDPAGRQTHRVLSGHEVRSLAESGIVQIGAHTVNHPRLASLPLAERRVEIVESREILEKLSGEPVTTFAYPYGDHADYGPETAGLVREAGLRCACSSFAGVVSGATDRFQIPRCEVGNYDGEKFARRLSEWWLR